MLKIQLRPFENEHHSCFSGHVPVLSQGQKASKKTRQPVAFGSAPTPLAGMQAVLKGRFGAARPAVNAKENSHGGAAAGPPAIKSPRKMLSPSRLRKAKKSEMEGCEGLCASVRSTLGAADIFAEGSAAFAQAKVSSRLTVGMKLSGATITDILVGGPANRHPDLEIGDTLVKVNGRDFAAGSFDFSRFASRDLAGGSVAVTVAKKSTGQLRDATMTRVVPDTNTDRRRIFELLSGLRDATGGRGEAGAKVDELAFLYARLSTCDSRTQEQQRTAFRDLQASAAEDLEHLRARLEAMRTGKPPPARDRGPAISLPTSGAAKTDNPFQHSGVEARALESCSALVAAKADEKEKEACQRAVLPLSYTHSLSLSHTLFLPRTLSRSHILFLPLTLSLTLSLRTRRSGR